MWIPYFSESLMISPKADPYQINEENKYHHSNEEELTQCPFVSQVFSIEDITGSEELRISAYGLYKCFINGKNITNDILTPGWVNYDDRLPYQTYNVSPFINKGKNTIQICSTFSRTSKIRRGELLRNQTERMESRANTQD